MTLMAMLERTDRVTARAHEVQFSTVAKTAVVGLFFALGWLVAKVFGVLFFGLVWVVMAIVDGWQEGIKSSPGRRVRSP